MPGGAQSLQSWTPTVNASQLAHIYKANLDSNSSIHSDVAGGFYVTPNSPVGLSVLVDQSFNLWCLYGGGTNGGHILINNLASPAVVTLTPPSANSYYATIYWNPTNNTAGVVYSPSSATPFPILPDQYEMLPVACVLINAGQATITAANIYDVRTFFCFGPVRYQNATFNANVTINAAGATLLTIDTKSTAAGFTITVNNLQVGIPVLLVTRASTFSMNFVFNTPSGIAYTSLTKQSGTAANFQALNPWTTNASQAYVLFGCTLYEGSAPYFIAPWN